MHSPGFETKCACDNVMCRNESRIEPETSTSSLTATPAAAEDGTVANYGTAVRRPTANKQKKHFTYLLYRRVVVLRYIIIIIMTSTTDIVSCTLTGESWLDLS